MIIEVQYIATYCILNRIMANEIDFDIHEYLKNHQFLSKLINKNGILFEFYGTAPSPSKDYGQILITIEQVIVRWWKITLRNIEGSIYPGEIKNSYEDFSNDELAQREITRIFGEQTLKYCLNFVSGYIDWFSHLPLNIQIKIFSYVNLDDIPQLSLVSKLFRRICRENELWKLFYIQQHGKNILENQDLIHLAERRGWRQVFFTNRLKLQMELRREAQMKQTRRHSFSNRISSPSLLLPLPNREGSDIDVIRNSLS